MKACKWWQVIENKVNVFSIVAASWFEVFHWFDWQSSDLMVSIPIYEYDCNAKKKVNTLFKNDKALFCLIQDK